MSAPQSVSSSLPHHRGRCGAARSVIPVQSPGLTFDWPMNAKKPFVGGWCPTCHHPQRVQYDVCGFRERGMPGLSGSPGLWEWRRFPATRLPRWGWTCVCYQTANNGEIRSDATSSLKIDVSRQVSIAGNSPARLSIGLAYLSMRKNERNRSLMMSDLSWPHAQRRRWTLCCCCCSETLLLLREKKPRRDPRDK